ncbi:MAG: hypothetical protein RL346_1663 [Verrucomicrobiota bacterium]
MKDREYLTTACLSLKMKRIIPTIRFCVWFAACANVLSAADPVPDISSVTPDLQVPALTEAEPGAGKRVKLRLFPETPPIVLYLPTDWSPDRKFPVIIELAGNGNFKNAYGDVCTGLPEDSRLGYGLTGGKGFIWVCVPFLNHAGNAVAVSWWGDAPEHRPDRTVAWIKRAVPVVCTRFSGHTERVILCGFSRGSIAVNAIGLHDDEIAAMWHAFFCYGHYDGVHEGWPFAGADPVSAKRRLLRLKGRPQFICHESVAGKLNLEATRRYLLTEKSPGDFTFVETGFRNHNDAWALRPSPARRAAREWLLRVSGEADVPAIHK